MNRSNIWMISAMIAVLAIATAAPARESDRKAERGRAERREQSRQPYGSPWMNPFWRARAMERLHAAPPDLRRDMLRRFMQMRAQRRGGGGPARGGGFSAGPMQGWMRRAPHWAPRGWGEWGRGRGLPFGHGDRMIAPARPPRRGSCPWASGRRDQLGTKKWAPPDHRAERPTPPPQAGGSADRPERSPAPPEEMARRMREMEQRLEAQRRELDKAREELRRREQELRERAERLHREIREREGDRERSEAEHQRRKRPQD